jgi:hypothetical protein
VDQKTRFTASRLKVIEECRPEIFYSQIINYDTHPGFRLIKLANYYPDNFLSLAIPEINKSYCSPFVAAGIAYKFHDATEIHLFGVDLITPLHFPLDQVHISKIKIHFSKLKAALKDKGCELIVHGNGILCTI